MLWALALGMPTIMITKLALSLLHQSNAAHCDCGESNRQVDAEITVDVSSQLSGRMAEVFVNFNDVVKAGQPLAQLDQESFIIAVNEAKAALRVAECDSTCPTSGGRASEARHRECTQR